ncbi:MAG: glycosyltransferase family 2 protein, partial [Micropruina sp.]|nr:glycosyltransferase family 2 protein [Micropruina sp.]
MMAWDVLWAVTTVFGVMILVAAAMRLAQVPFALAHAVKYRALPKDAPPQAGSIFASPPSVSVIVPAYNEGVVLENCLRSIVASDYPDVEVICVDDGSSDNTYDLMRQLAAELPGVTAMRQQNAGKGAALNRGIKASRGEVLLLVDADGVFARDTITEMVRGFDDDLIGAVCGDDRPVNLDRVQTRFLALISHVGTGLMRRALHMLGALPVVSGNSGAFRRDVLDATGLLREDTIGEDLEL